MSSSNNTRKDARPSSLIVNDAKEPRAPITILFKLSPSGPSAGLLCRRPSTAVNLLDVALRCGARRRAARRNKAPHCIVMRGTEARGVVLWHAD
jgi:hypothetical protein